MKSKIRVRKVTNWAKYFEGLLKVEKICFPRTFAATKDDCEVIKYHAARGRYVAWEARDEKGRIVGTASLWLSKKRGGPLYSDINSAAILPEFQGKGVYKKLLRARVNFLKREKVAFFEVQCATKNEKMMNFWTKKTAEGKTTQTRPYRGRKYQTHYYSTRKKTDLVEFRGYLENW